MAAEAVAGLIDEMVGQPDAAPVEGEQASTEPEAQEATFEFPSFTADTEGIEDLLDEPDYGIITEDEPEDEPEDLSVGEYDDPEVAKLKAKLAKAEKQIRYQSELRAKSSLKEWRAEGARRFPLADVDEIEGTSRRAVLRKAQEQHDRYERKLKPTLDAVDLLRAQVIAEAKNEGKDQAIAGWGRPTSGPNITAVEAVELANNDPNKHDRRQYTNAHDSIRSRFKKGFQL